MSWSRLKARMEELKDLSGVIGLLTWDQETYLPPSGSTARGQQLSTLQGLYHERLVDPAVGDWLQEAQRGALSEDDRAMVRVFKRERDRAVNVPPSLVRALAEAQTAGLVAWRKARDAKDFSLFKDALAHLLKLRREQADALGHDGERYNALLDGFEPDMRVARLKPVLEGLRDKLIPIVQVLTGDKVKQPRDVFAGKSFDPERQWTFTLRLLTDMGFDLRAGRQDKSIHPFTGGTHPTDVRLTTRVEPENPLSTLFSTIHEGGHGLYEQGFAARDFRTPLAASPSMGLHESQSRLWENLVGRSRAFWEHYLPVFRELFPKEVDGVSVDDFHRSINQVSRSYVRTEADEVTYNLHIVLRFELELLLIHDDLPLDDLPQAWDDRMEKYLGVRPRHHVEGVLQDIHWAWGEFGYFPTYALGNLYAAQIFGTLRQERPELNDVLREGRLVEVRDWLRQRIHRVGYRMPAEALVQNVTGAGLSDGPFIDYLREKYAALYGIPVP